MPPPERQRRPAGGAAPSATVRISTQSFSRSIGTAQLLRLRFRQLTNRLWRSGPRLTDELLLEIAAAIELERDHDLGLEPVGEFGPMAVARLGGRTSAPLPLSEVA